MPARNQVSFIISAKDRTRAVFRGVLRQVRRIRFGLKSLAGLVGFGALTRDTLKFAAALDGASRRLRIPVEQLNALQQSAKAFDLSGEQLVQILQRIGTRAGEAVNGSSRMAENFAKIGVDIALLRKNDPQAVLLAVADAAKAANDAGKNFSFQADLVKVLDTEAGRALAFLQQGAAQIQAEQRRLIKEGGVINEAQNKALAERQAQIQENFARFQTAFAEILGKFAPAAERLALVLGNVVDALTSGSLLDSIKSNAIDASKNIGLIPDFVAELGQKIKREVFGTPGVTEVSRSTAPTRGEREIVDALSAIERNTSRNTVARLGR